MRYTFADPASPPVLKRVEPTAIRAGESTDLNLLGEYLLPGRGARCVFGAGRSDDDGAGWTDAVVLDGQRATCPSAAPTEGARRDRPLASFPGTPLGDSSLMVCPGRLIQARRSRWRSFSTAHPPRPTRCISP